MSSRIPTISNTISSALISALVIYISLSFRASATTTAPDFAFPTKVSEQSLTTLHQAIRKSDCPAAIRSLIDYTLARNAVSSDDPSQAIAFIDSVGESMDGPARIMTDLLVMRLYSDVYRSSMWTYNNRTLPLTPLPENCLEWSGSQFRHKLLNLGEKILASSEELAKVPLKTYSKVITSDRLTYVYYPTLWDFAASQIVQTLSSYINGANDSLYALVDDTYTAVIKASANHTAPLINASLNQAEFRSNYNSSDLSSRVKSMEALYDRFSKSEYSGDIILALSHLTDGTQQANRRIYDLINSHIKAFPSYYGNNALRNRLHELSRPGVQASVPSACAPGQPVKVRLNVSNASSVGLAVYEITSPTVITGSWVELNRQPSKRLVRRITQQFDTKVPFDTTVTVTLPALPHIGYYAVAPELPGVTIDGGNSSVPLLHCTRTALGYLSISSGSMPVMAVGIDPLTGAPLAEATVNIIDSGSKTSTQSHRLIPVGSTDGEGFMLLSGNNTNNDTSAKRSGNSGNSCDYLLTKGDDHYGVPLWINPRNYQSAVRQNVSGEIFTSLAIVHPGDTVGVAAVAYTYGPEGRRVMAHTPMKIVLRDVNGNAVDTLRATSDAFGRIHGRFDIPRGQLTGNYSLILSRDGAKDGDTSLSTNIAYGSLMVSDYKLPTFKVEIEKVLQGTPSKGDVTLTGRIVTYSGFGLGDATAEMRLSVNRSFWWWRGGDVQEVAAMPVALNADGTFTLTVDSATLARSPYRQGSYTAEITAVSPAGETQSATKRFAIGEAYTIRADIPATIEASSPIHLNVSVIDAEDNPVETTLRYAIVNTASGISYGTEAYAATDTVAQGSFSTSDPIVDLTHVAPGTYSIILIPTGKIADACEKETSGNVAIYRRGVNISPSRDMLWIADRNLTATPGETVDITFGMPQREEGVYHVLCILSANDSIIQRRWMEATPGFNTLTVQMPQALSAEIILCSTSDYVNARTDVTLTSPAMRRSLRVERESFRDKLMPGGPERWTLRILDATPATGSSTGEVATGVKSAVMARMYNQALDALTASSLWQLSPRSYTPSAPSWRSPSIGSTLYPSLYGKISYLRTTPLVQPEFDTYGRSLYYRGHTLYIRGSRSVKSSLTSNAVMTEDAIDDEVMTMSVMVDYKMAKAEASAPMMTGGKAAGITVNETEAEVTEEDNGNTQDDTHDIQGNDTFDYRDSEVPLAFFRPTLASDPDGAVTISFTTPNANARWCFDLLAWTEEMITGSMSADVVSSKPIMVQPNLPRFLRTGDKVTLKAMVMSNSTDTCNVTTVIEIFDPTTLSHIGLPVTNVATIAPGSSATVAMEVEVPAGIRMIGYRVRSKAGEFTDGEQTVIPVLPSSQPVVETEPFYLAPGNEDFTMKIPDIDKKSIKETKVTLQYCNNPAWYVITALPGIAPEQPTTATDAAVTLMSSAIARGIVRKYPAIGEALRQWKESDRTDSTLVSMLERNQDLKTLLLQETPWMSQAASDTERMARLVLLTDSKRCDESIRSCIDLLSKLLTPEGAWSWSSSFTRPSEWVTYTVLRSIGRIKELGFMPDDSRLTDMVRSAVAYCDREIVKTYSQNPDGVYTGYVTMCDMFPDVAQSSEARKVSDRTVQYIIGHWRNYDIAAKASASRILSRHGYTSTAKEVIASILDYAVTTPQGAIWWPSANGGALGQLTCAADVLDALTVVDAKSSDIDRIRQWLVLQKEARNWGSGTVATNVIASFITSTPSEASSWLTTGSDYDTRITLGRHKVKFTPEDKTLGYMRTDISSLHPSGATLRIRREAAGHGPAWGAVISQFEALMDSIAPEACDAVSITKRITSLSGNSRVQTGDKVRVQLIIHVNEPMDYVAITDERAACLEPVEQLPGYIYSEGLSFYRENRDASTRIFIDHLPRGIYILIYDMYAAQAGRFASGVATLQSQYAPALSAHSASSPLTVEQ